MSDLSDQGSSTAKETSGGATRTRNIHMVTNNWEERLEIARAAREKVLKAKGKPLSRPKVQRPRFLDEDPAARMASYGAEGTVAHNLSQAPEKPDPDLAGEAVRLVETLSDAVQVTTHPPAKAGGISGTRIVSVAFAGFFGLGFGMVLSFGAVVSLGWISIKESAPVAPVEVISDATARSAPPDVDASVLAALAPISSDRAQTGFAHAALTPVPDKMRATPRVFSALQTIDRVPDPVRSPAPRFGMGPLGADFSAPQTIEAVTLARQVDPPVPLAAMVAQSAWTDTAHDTRPVVPEQSNLDIQTRLAVLLSPPGIRAQTHVASIMDIVPVRMPTPSLFKTGSETVLEVSWSEPEKLMVFDTGLSAMSASAQAEVAVVVHRRSFERPPALVQPIRASLSTDAQIGLPAVGGPPEARPSLALQLGHNREMAQRFNLVTFAPANVPAARIASNSDVLNATGFPVSTVHRVNFKVSQTHVRYYSKEDERVALAIAEQVGGKARDFTAARNSPPAGQVEVWLEGNRTYQARTTSSRPATSAAQRNAARKSQLVNQLATRLRSGEHLSGQSR